jgi:hypothetical protein
MNKFLSSNKYLNNTYFSESFKAYPTLANKRRNLNIVLCIGIFIPFISLLMLRNHYDSVIGTDFQLIVSRVFYAMLLGSMIIMPIIFSVENKINKMMLCSTHHLVYSKCELKKMIGMIENDKKGELPINTNHPLYHDLKKLHSLIEQYSFIYVSKINTSQLKDINFTTHLSLVDIEKEIQNEVNGILTQPKKMNQLEQLELKIKEANINCLDTLYHHKLNDLHAKCFNKNTTHEELKPFKALLATIRTLT